MKQLNTITAKELRDNLEELLKKADRGETFHVTYRSKVVATISRPDQNEDRYSGAEVGKRLESLIKELPSSITPMLRKSKKPYKQLRDELYLRDPKYRRFLSARSIDE